MAIAPGLIWRAIFVFIRASLYPFLRKILAGVAKKLRDTEGLPFAKAKARPVPRISRIRETWVFCRRHTHRRERNAARAARRAFIRQEVIRGTECARPRNSLQES